MAGSEGSVKIRKRIIIISMSVYKYISPVTEISDYLMSFVRVVGIIYRDVFELMGLFSFTVYLFGLFNYLFVDECLYLHIHSQSL